MAIAPHSTRSLYLFYIRAWLASVKVQPYGIICGRLPEGTLAEFLKYSWPEKWLVSVRHIVCYSTQQTLAISLRRWYFINTIIRLWYFRIVNVVALGQMNMNTKNVQQKKRKKKNGLRGKFSDDEWETGGADQFAFVRRVFMIYI